eukprot:SAG31_NODE_220_length_19925_cov_3.630939_14_plen_80_part_00
MSSFFIIYDAFMQQVTFKQMVAESLPDLSYLTFLDKYTIVGIIILTGATQFVPCASFADAQTCDLTTRITPSLMLLLWV